MHNIPENRRINTIISENPGCQEPLRDQFQGFALAYTEPLQSYCS